ncbi:MAG: hypothetical protein JWN93_3790 [Hyphomicrobiales bacterium]|nr:hypothetical protein [Hyphomicrobiales bacterium]
MRRALCLALLTALSLAAPQGPLGSAARAQSGDLAKAPVPAATQSAILEGIRSQLLDPGSAEITFLVHFPLVRADLGRVCGEVSEPGPAGPHVRTFYALYSRTGRVLVRLEDERFADYLKQDTVFRNCSPRL